MPTETLARWAWHSETNPRGYTLADARPPHTEADGRTVAYPTDANSDAGQWLRRNPHDLPLGQIAFEAIGPDDIREPRQTLDLWRGVIQSRYTLDGQAVKVTTAAHPDLDLVAVRVDSTLLTKGRLRVRLAFPRGHDLAVKNTPALDWSGPTRTGRRSNGARGVSTCCAPSTTRATTCRSPGVARPICARRLRTGSRWPRARARSPSSSASRPTWPPACRQRTRP